MANDKINIQGNVSINTDSQSIEETKKQLDSLWNNSGKTFSSFIQSIIGPDGFGKVTNASDAMAQAFKKLTEDQKILQAGIERTVDTRKLVELNQQLEKVQKNLLSIQDARANLEIQEKNANAKSYNIGSQIPLNITTSYYKDKKSGQVRGGVALQSSMLEGLPKAWGKGVVKKGESISIPELVAMLEKNQQITEGSSQGLKSGSVIKTVLNELATASGEYWDYQMDEDANLIRWASNVIKRQVEKLKGPNKDYLDEVRQNIQDSMQEGMDYWYKNASPEEKRIRKEYNRMYSSDRIGGDTISGTSESQLSQQTVDDRKAEQARKELRDRLADANKKKSIYDPRYDENEEALVDEIINNYEKLLIDSGKVDKKRNGVVPLKQLANAIIEEAIPMRETAPVRKDGTVDWKAENIDMTLKSIIRFVKEAGYIKEANPYIDDYLGDNNQDLLRLMQWLQDSLESNPNLQDFLKGNFSEEQASQMGAELPKFLENLMDAMIKFQDDNGDKITNKDFQKQLRFKVIQISKILGHLRSKNIESAIYDTDSGFDSVYGLKQLQPYLDEYANAQSPQEKGSITRRLNKDIKDKKVWFNDPDFLKKLFDNFKGQTYEQARQNWIDSNVIESQTLSPENQKTLWADLIRHTAIKNQYDPNSRRSILSKMGVPTEGYYAENIGVSEVGGLPMYLFDKLPNFINRERGDWWGDEVEPLTTEQGKLQGFNKLLDMIDEYASKIKLLENKGLEESPAAQDLNNRIQFALKNLNLIYQYMSSDTRTSAQNLINSNGSSTPLFQLPSGQIIREQDVSLDDYTGIIKQFQERSKSMSQQDRDGAIKELNALREKFLDLGINEVDDENADLLAEKRSLERLLSDMKEGKLNRIRPEYLVNEEEGYVNSERYEDINLDEVKVTKAGYITKKSLEQRLKKVNDSIRTDNSQYIEILKLLDITLDDLEEESKRNEEQLKQTSKETTGETLTKPIIEQPKKANAAIIPKKLQIGIGAPPIIEKEEEAIQNVNETLSEHEEKVENAVEAESQKIIVSGKLADTLKEEKKATDDATDAVVDHVEELAKVDESTFKPIDVQFHDKDSKGNPAHYYTTVNSNGQQEFVMSATQLRSKLMNKEDPSFQSTIDYINNALNATPKGNVVTADSLGMDQKDFDFYAKGFVGKGFRGTLFHSAIEALSKSQFSGNIDDLEKNWKQILQNNSELAEQYENLAKLGLNDDNFVHLEQSLMGYFDAVRKSGMTFSNFSEQALGFELGGNKGTFKVAVTPDQLMNYQDELGVNRSAVVDNKRSAMRGYESFQLTLEKMGMLANKNNPAFASLFQGSDVTDDVKLYVANVEDGKTQLVEFASLTMQEIYELLVKAQDGVKLTDEEINYIKSKQLKFGKYTGSSSVPATNADDWGRKPDQETVFKGDTAQEVSDNFNNSNKIDEIANYNTAIAQYQKAQQEIIKLTGQAQELDAIKLANEKRISELKKIGTTTAKEEISDLTRQNELLSAKRETIDANIRTQQVLKDSTQVEDYMTGRSNKGILPSEIMSKLKSNEIKNQNAMEAQESTAKANAEEKVSIQLQERKNSLIDKYVSIYEQYLKLQSEIHKLEISNDTTEKGKEQLAIAQEKSNELKKQIDLYDSYISSGSIDGIILTNDDQSRIQENVQRLQVEKNQRDRLIDAGNTDATNDSTTKKQLQAIREWQDAVKKSFMYERDMAKVRKEMEGLSGDQLKDAQAKLNILQRQHAKYNEIVNGYNRGQKILNGVALTDEQILKQEQFLTEQHNIQDAKLIDIAGQYTKQKGLLAQIAGGFKNAFRNITDASLAYMIINQVKQVVNQIIESTKELDAVLVDIQIATGNTRGEVHNLLKEYSNLADELGTTTQSVATASNDWLRAGYEGQEAAELTRASVMLSKLGMIEAGDATTYLISTLKGWKIEASEVLGVVDKLTVIKCGVCLEISIGHEFKCR